MEFTFGISPSPRPWSTFDPLRVNFTRYPAAVEIPRLRLHLFPIDVTIPLPLLVTVDARVGVKRNMVLDRSKSAVRRRIGPDSVLHRGGT